jgi:hypothetical protein
MEYNHEKVDEMVLALLWLTPAGPRRAWKLHPLGNDGTPSCEGVHHRPEVEGEVGSVQRRWRAPGAGTL